jgi:hypothetical protein
MGALALKIRSYGKPKLDTDLRYLPAQDWIVKQLLILGWYDGPLEGFCELQTPELVLHFKIVAEFYVEDGVDDRLFDIRICDKEKYKTLCEVLSHQIDLEKQTTVVPPLSTAEDNMITELIKSSVESFLLIQSQTMRSFSRVWSKA